MKTMCDCRLTWPKSVMLLENDLRERKKWAQESYTSIVDALLIDTWIVRLRRWELLLFTCEKNKQNARDPQEGIASDLSLNIYLEYKYVYNIRNICYILRPKVSQLEECTNSAIRLVEMIWVWRKIICLFFHTDNTREASLNRLIEYWSATS